MQPTRPKEVNAVFHQLCRSLGVAVGKEPGQWHLTYYGGGIRIETTDKKGKVYHPLSSNCYSPKEFILVGMFAMNVLTKYESLKMSSHNPNITSMLMPEFQESR